MTKFYIVYNRDDCYNIYSTRERADLACKKMIDRALIYSDESQDTLNNYYYVFEVEEGETFGDVLVEELRKESQDIILD